MKNGVLLSSNLPSVIDRSNLSHSREAGGYKFDWLMTQGNLLDNKTTLKAFSFFISILMMTKGTQKTDDRTDSWNADSRNKPVTTG